MPIYEYRCDNGHTFEVMQRMADDPLSKCEVCGAPVQRVFHPVAIHFKGKGFYNTDYGKKSRGSASRDGDGSRSDSGDSGDSKSNSKPDSKPKETAATSSSSSKPDSGSGSSSSGSKSD